MIEIINLRSGSVAIVNPETGDLIANYPSGSPATCEVELKRDGVVDGTIIYRNKYRNVTGLPGPEENPEALYIVDDDVAEAVRDSRMDLVLPHQPVESDKHENAYTGLITVA